MNEESNVVDLNNTPAEASASEKRTNRQAEAAEPFLEQIEAQQAKIDAINAQAKLDAAPMRVAIAEKKKAMREETGVDVKAANLELKARKLSRQMVQAVSNASENTKEDFAILHDKMGQGLFNFDEALQATNSG